MLFSFLPAQDTHTGVKHVNSEKNVSSLTHILCELTGNWWFLEAVKLFLTSCFFKKPGKTSSGISIITQRKKLTHPTNRRVSD